MYAETFLAITVFFVLALVMIGYFFIFRIEKRLDVECITQDRISEDLRRDLYEVKIKLNMTGERRKEWIRMQGSSGDSC
jgi:hypothetical protein